jgi:hypothetical protein
MICCLRGNSIMLQACFLLSCLTNKEPCLLPSELIRTTSKHIMCQVKSSLLWSRCKHSQCVPKRLVIIWFSNLQSRKCFQCSQATHKPQKRDARLGRAHPHWQESKHFSFVSYRCITRYTYLIFASRKTLLQKVFLPSGMSSRLTELQGWVELCLARHM